MFAFSARPCYDRAGKGGIVVRRSDQREKMLAYIRSYAAEHGYGPSVRELCRALDLKSTATVHYHLRALAEEGAVVMEAGKKRSISLPRQEEAKQSAEYSIMSTKPEKRTARIPVLGAVAAGRPILAQEYTEGTLPWEGGEGWFALRVQGESMKNAGILPGDKVIVRPQPTAENGEIVVALLGDEATVKRFSRRGGRILLLPENEAFEPIDGREAQILGVVRGVIREY